MGALRWLDPLAAVAGAAVLIAMVGGCGQSDGGGNVQPIVTGDRATADGLTFVVPERLTDVVEVRSVGAGTPASSVVLALYDVDANSLGAVSATLVRDDEGEQTRAYDEDRALIVALENGSAPGERIPFVNGSGVRVVDQEYVFVGLTTEGSHLVEVRASSELAVAQLDSLTRSIFVDAQSDALSASSCEVGVDVIGEVLFAGASTVAPGEPVTASWRTRNSGSCPWSERDGWVFAGGDAVEVLSVSQVTGVVPGQATDVSVTLRAPDEAGTYSTQWQFLPAGELSLIDTPIPVVFDVAPD